MRSRDGKCGGLADVAAIEQHGACLDAQAFALALRAARIAAILRQHDAHMQLVLLALHQLKEAIDAEEAAIALEHEALLRWSKVIPRHVQWNTFLTACTAQLGLVGPVLRPSPRIDGPIV